ncbi:prolipoprotein diacylglyceryl transferase [Flavobacterium sp.]|uniref:prolipoprotein diacylglyceryl transferase n=1 Tax=Flavobacterium sp. TaxID=239 RepID=UPI003263924D
MVQFIFAKRCRSINCDHVRGRFPSVMFPSLSLCLAVFVHTPHPFLGPHWGNVGIRCYGLAYLLGFLGSVYLLRLYHRKGRSPFGENTVSDLMTHIVLGVLLGGRIGYFLLYQLENLRADPLSVFRVWEGGMASHGGMIGVLLALLWFARKRQVPFFHLSDLIVTTAPLGLLLGRIANYLNGELWGKPSDAPWAVIFSQTGGGPIPRHPSQLYEAFLEGALLLAYLQWRFWRSPVYRENPGRLSGEFLIGYAVVRAVGEIFREPDAALIFGLSRGTFYSTFLIAAGLVLLRRSRRSTA